MSEHLLVLDDVSVTVGDAELLSGVSLAVAPGTAVGLIGETGSGKTMTVRTATGLLASIGGRVTSGSVFVGGADLTRATPRQWRRWQGKAISLVPQSSMSGLDPVMPVGKQVAEALLIAGHGADRRTEVARLLTSVKLEPSPWLLRAYPHQLSGGMRQRVMIALALAGEPAMIVADEPTTAVDAAIRHEILELLDSLRREKNIGLLLVSHDISAIAAATDTTAVMYGGRVVESGPTSQVVHDPQHPYTVALIGALPDRTPPGGRLPAIPGQPPLAGEIPPGCAFEQRCPSATERCRLIRPPLVPIGDSRSAACLLIDRKLSQEPDDAVEVGA